MCLVLVHVHSMSKDSYCKKLFLCVPSIPSVILDGLVFQFPGLVSKPLQLGKLRGGVVHVSNISWASAVEYTVPCWSSPKSCKIQLLGSYLEKAAKA